MTAGSIAGVLLVLAWSRVDSLLAFYALWVGIGVVMAAVLYAPVRSFLLTIVEREARECLARDACAALA